MHSSPISVTAKEIRDLTDQHPKIKKINKNMYCNFLNSKSLFVEKINP